VPAVPGGSRHCGLCGAHRLHRTQLCREIPTVIHYCVLAIGSRYLYGEYTTYTHCSERLKYQGPNINYFISMGNKNILSNHYEKRQIDGSRAGVDRSGSSVVMPVEGGGGQSTARGSRRVLMTKIGRYLTVRSDQ
jgi:hypothetical protein